jgi:type IV pilus assembly protein PilN
MTINLLPWREAQAQRKARQCGILLLFSAALIFITTITIHYYLNFLKIRYQTRNQELAHEIDSLQIHDDDKKLSEDYQITAQQIKLIETIESHQKSFWLEFAFLQQDLPEDIQLNNLLWIEQSLHLQGIASHSENIGLLVEKLEKSHLFSQVNLETIDGDNKNSLIHFVIHAERTEVSKP